MKDEILTELWMIKDSIAKENNNNVNTLMNHLKSIQDSSGRRVVNRFQNKTGRVYRLATENSPLTLDA